VPVRDLSRAARWVLDRDQGYIAESVKAGADPTSDGNGHASWHRPLGRCPVLVRGSFTAAHKSAIVA